MSTRALYSMQQLPYLNSLTLCPVNAAAPLDIDDDVVSGVLSSEMTERSSFGRMDAVALARFLVVDERSPAEAPERTERSLRCCCRRDVAAVEKLKWRCCWWFVVDGGCTSDSLRNVKSG